MVYLKSHLYFFFFILSLTISGQIVPVKNHMLSADANFGYNLTRIKTNYLFEQNMPLSFQINYHKANYLDSLNLGRFGYSDFGLTFLYHDFRNPVIGKNYGIYGFMAYYLNKPFHRWQWSFRVSQGMAYNTHPYDKKSNTKNLNFGSHWLFPFDIALYLKSPKILQHWRMQLGLAIFHYSNGNLQSPNYGANIPSITVGILYDDRPDVIKNKEFPEYEKAWQYRVFLRFGVNESDYYDSGIFPFFIPGLQVEKHLSYRHKIYFGTELYLSYFLREQIRYEYYSQPEMQLKKIYDFKRIGAYVGHEFYYDKFGIDIAFGYYLYYPYHFETRFYNRLGTKYRINKHITALYSLKVHSINRAEAMEFGLMYRFK